MTPQFDPYFHWLGIVPNGTPVDFYRLLGLPPGTSDPNWIVREAQARFNHLQSQRTEATAAWIDPLMAEISAACACLQDPRTKANYDRQWFPPTPTHQPVLSQPMVVAKRLPVAIATPIAPPPLPISVAPQAIVAEPTPAIAASTASTKFGPPGRRADHTTTIVFAVASIAAVAAAVGLLRSSAPQNKPKTLVSAETSHLDRGTAVSKMAEVASKTDEELDSPPVKWSEPRVTNSSGLSSFEAVVAHAKRAVVRVETDRGLGSGVVIDERGIIATNFHVVEGSRNAQVVFADDTKCLVDGYMYVSEECDLCLLQIDTKGRSLIALPLAKELPAQGKAVFTFGNPQGLRFTVTKGVVSAVTTTTELEVVARSFRMTLGKPGEADWIQTDASIDQGNSGGPLLDDAGIVYGLNTFFLNNVANAYFANTAPAIRHAMQSRKAVRDLASLPGRQPSLPVPHGGDPRDPSPPMIALPDAIVKDIEKRVAAGDFAPVVKTMIEHREKALLNAKIILANKARDLQKTLADVETGKTSIIQMATNDLLATAGGADFALYLLLIREIDEKIERQGNVEATAQKLAAMLTGSGDALTKVTAACALHRIHVRDSSRTRIPELLTFLSQGESNYASESILTWYLQHHSRPISPLQAVVLRDIQIEQDRNRGLRGAQENLLSGALKRVKAYNETLGGKLYEHGLTDWRFRCIPQPKGLEMSLGTGTSRLILPNDYGLTEPCDVLMTAKVSEREQVLGVDNNLRVFFKLQADDLSQIVLHRIIYADQEGKHAVCLPLRKVATE